MKIDPFYDKNMLLKGKINYFILIIMNFILNISEMEI